MFTQEPNGMGLLRPSPPQGGPRTTTQRASRYRRLINTTESAANVSVKMGSLERDDNRRRNMAKGEYQDHLEERPSVWEEAQTINDERNIQSKLLMNKIGEHQRLKIEESERQKSKERLHRGSVKYTVINETEKKMEKVKVSTQGHNDMGQLRPNPPQGSPRTNTQRASRYRRLINTTDSVANESVKMGSLERDDGGRRNMAKAEYQDHLEERPSVWEEAQTINDERNIQSKLIVKGIGEHQRLKIEESERQKSKERLHLGSVKYTVINETEKKMEKVKVSSQGHNDMGQLRPNPPQGCPRTNTQRASRYRRLINTTDSAANESVKMGSLARNDNGRRNMAKGEYQNHLEKMHSVWEDAQTIHDERNLQRKLQLKELGEIQRLQIEQRELQKSKETPHRGRKKETIIIETKREFEKVKVSTQENKNMGKLPATLCQSMAKDQYQEHLGKRTSIWEDVQTQHEGSKMLRKVMCKELEVNQQLKMKEKEKQKARERLQKEKEREMGRLEIELDKRMSRRLEEQKSELKKVELENRLDDISRKNCVRDKKAWNSSTEPEKWQYTQKEAERLVQEESKMKAKWTVEMIKMQKLINSAAAERHGELLALKRRDLLEDPRKVRFGSISPASNLQIFQGERKCPLGSDH
ncbi:uncharacterized protein AB9W97_007526 isoform 1-T3 [Spinachia spinachia]